MRKLRWILLTALLVVPTLFSVRSVGAQIETFEGRLEIIRADNFVTGVSTTTYYLNKSAGSANEITIAATATGGATAAVTVTSSV